MKKLIKIAAAVIVHENCILLTRRSKKTSYAGMWELPGGKVEKGESGPEAVVREIEEELGIIVRLESDLPIATHFAEAGEKSWVVCMYHCALRDSADYRRIKLAPQLSEYRLFSIGQDPDPERYACLKGTYKAFAQVRKIFDAE